MTVDGWTKRNLADVVALQRGFDLPHHARRPGPYPVLTSGETGGFHDEGPVKGPGVTIGRATNLGQPKWADGDFWPHNTTMYVKDFKGNHPRWVFHLFEHIDLAGYDSGSVQPMLNRNYIARVQVDVPPPSEQRAIAEVLGALDDKIAANNDLIATAEELSQTIFRAGSLSSELEPQSLGELIASGAVVMSDGYRTKKSEHAAQGFRIIRAGDVTEARVNLTGSDFVSADFASVIGAKRAHPRDIVITTKGTVGRVAVMHRAKERAVFSPQLCFVRVLKEELADSAYLAAWFKSVEFGAQASERMHKTDMAPYINLADMRSIRIPLPDPEVQRELGTKLRALQDLVETRWSESQALRHLRDSLLPALMSGRVRVKDVEKSAEELV